MSKYSFLFLLFCLMCSTSSYSQRIHEQGLKLYWKSMKKLEKKGALADEQWQALWDAPGFNKWMGSTRSQDIFKRLFTLVYVPAYQDTFQQELRESTGYRRTMLAHAQTVKEERKQIQKFVKKLNSSDIIAQAKAIVADYLPSSFDIKEDHTAINLMIFQPDAFAHEEEILMDALFAYQYGDGLEYLLAHELHHIYVSYYLSRLRTVHENDPYFSLFNSVNTLRLEGTADLIDKADILDRTPKTEYEEKYAAHYHASKSHLQTIDSLLHRLSLDESQLESYSKQIRRELPYNGHPTGLYIAHLIEKHKGRAGIIACLGNPFTFLQMYNEIASEFPADYHVFSAESMAYLEALRSRFLAEKK